LSGTTDNVALLDTIRAQVGDDPQQWLPLLLDAVHDRKNKTSPRRTP
jgi:type IV secretion system protein VirB4